MVIEFEREVYRTERPRQLARQDLFLRIGEPIEPGRLISDWLSCRGVSPTSARLVAHFEAVISESRSKKLGRLTHQVASLQIPINGNLGEYCIGQLLTEEGGYQHDVRYRHDAQGAFSVGEGSSRRVGPA